MKKQQLESISKISKKNFSPEILRKVYDYYYAQRQLSSRQSDSSNLEIENPKKTMRDNQSDVDQYLTLKKDYFYEQANKIKEKYTKECESLYEKDPYNFIKQTFITFTASSSAPGLIFLERKQVKINEQLQIQQAKSQKETQEAAENDAWMLDIDSNYITKETHSIIETIVTDRKKIIKNKKTIIGLIKSTEEILKQSNLETLSGKFKKL